MRLGLLILLLTASLSSLYSQRIDVFGGLNSNKLYNYSKSNAHLSYEYSPGWGGVIGIGISDIDAVWHKLRLSLNFEKYGGNIDYYSGGNGGGSGIIADFDKSIISIGVFPVNFNIKDKIDINIGIKMSVLVYETFEGTQRSWGIGQESKIYDLKDKYDSFSPTFYFGIQGRIAYNIKLSEKYFLTPQYSYYFGLSREFSEIPRETKSRRHYFCLGIVKKLN